MPYAAGATFLKTFCTRGNSGSVNADSLPTAAMVRNGVTDGAVTCTVTNVSTGRYKVSGVIGAYTTGDQIEILVSAAVDGITDLFTIDLGLVSPAAPGYFASDVYKTKGTASAGAAGYMGVDWGQVNNPASTVNLANTSILLTGTVFNRVAADVQAIEGDTNAAVNAKVAFRSGVTGVAASGVVGILSLPPDGMTTTATDRAGTVATFTWAAVNPGGVIWIDTSSGDEDVIATNVATAYAANLAMTAVAFLNVVTLTDTATGTAGNVAMTSSDASVSVSGMSGGVDAVAAGTLTLASGGFLPVIGNTGFVLASHTDVTTLGTSALFTAANGATLQTTANNIVNLSALANLYGPTAMEIPASGSIAYSMQLLVKDPEGHSINLNASPTVTAANTAGTDRSANLSAVSHPGTGHYTFTYTVLSSAAQEGLVVTATGTTVAPDSTSRIAVLSAAVVAVDTATQIAAIQAQTTAAQQQANVQAGMTTQGYTTTLATGLGTTNSTVATNLDATVSSRSTVAGIWDALTSGITTAGSIGKRLLDFVTSLVYSAPPTAAQNAAAVLTDTGDQGTALTLGSMVKGLNSMLTASGSNSTYTVDALKNAPSGGGGNSIVVTQSPPIVVK